MLATLALAAAIAWQPWTDDVFQRAQKEGNKLVLLDLEAVWCHWCHVMDEVTYQDPKVQALLAKKYLAVKVDQDSRPDLSNRYEDYGWPATIIFDAKGQELVKRSGYLEPASMLKVLQAVVDDPTPGPSVKPVAPVAFAASPFLPAARKVQLKKDYEDRFDGKLGSWGEGKQKFLDWDSTEYSLALALRGDAAAERRARLTFEGELNLLDPAWGGVYQYSTDGDWKHPHFEKIMQYQAENMRLFALGGAQLAEPRYTAAAQAIFGFLHKFLRSPEGAFYVSQDADLVQGEHGGEFFALSDVQRRARGIPRVDQHVYARENGWAIQGLAQLYAATGDAAALEDATTAVKWIQAHRGLDGGGFRHDDKDAAGPFLGDTLAMGRAFLALHAATGERAYLLLAADAAGFIRKTFADKDPGFPTVAKAPAAGLPPTRLRDENIAAARFFNLLSRYTGAKDDRAAAESAMRYLAAPTIADRFITAGVLLADAELADAPVHIVIVGPKDAPEAKALQLAALAYPAPYKRAEWWDKREGPLPNAEVQYPDVKKPAAFACTGNRCSLPAFKPEDIRRRIDAIQAPQ